MKVVAFNGSPRKEGNTRDAINVVLGSILGTLFLIMLFIHIAPLRPFD